MACILATLLFPLTGCGRPKPPDLRSEMSSSVTQLGLRPVYPPTETLRLGTVLLADASVGRPFGGALAYQETSFRVTGDLEELFEQARRKRYSNANRFAQSSATLAAALRPATTGTDFYRQLPEKLEDRTPENALPLAALPGFSLASVDQVSLSAFVPDIVASFFGAIGLRHTSFLRLEAEGVESAELPLADFLDALEQSCASSAIRARRDRYVQAVALGQTLFGAQRDRRLAELSEKTSAPDTSLLIMRRVFYMRGVRFVVSDSRVGTAVLQAAIRNTLPSDVTPVPLPALTVNTTVTPGAQGTLPPEAVAANAAAITVLQSQIEQLRSATGTGGNNQLSLSLARAAGTGIELVQLFDRPLAFGYQAVEVGTDSPGLAPLCALVGQAL